MTTPIETIADIDNELVALGWPETSPWWRDVLERFYGTPGKTQLTARVGRRGGKSSTICRVAVSESLSDRHKIQPGDVGIIPIVSADRSQAQLRLRTIHAILAALRVPHDMKMDEIELHDRPVIFRTTTASVKGAAGFTSIAIVADEVARWSNDAGANPAEEILASLRPTLATMPHGKTFLISSPLLEDSLHEKEMALGDTGFRMAAHAESWIANPTLTEAHCRGLAANDREFAREYMAIAQPGLVDSFYPLDAIRRCTFDYRSAEAPTHIWHYSMAIDPGTTASGGAWANVVCHAEPYRAGVRVVCDHISEIVARPGETLDPGVCVSRSAQIRKTFPGAYLLTDQASFVYLQREFARLHVELVKRDWSAGSLMAAHTTVRQLMMDDRLVMPSGTRLQSQLGRIGIKLTATGEESVSAKGGHIGDIASAFAACVHESFRVGAIGGGGAMGWNRPQSIGTRRMG